MCPGVYSRSCVPIAVGGGAPIRCFGSRPAAACVAIVAHRRGNGFRASAWVRLLASFWEQLPGVDEGRGFRASAWLSSFGGRFLVFASAPLPLGFVSRPPLRPAGGRPLVFYLVNRRVPGLPPVGRLRVPPASACITALQPRYGVSRAVSRSG